jgi:hypothetical protein
VLADIDEHGPPRGLVAQGEWAVDAGTQFGFSSSHRKWPFVVGGIRTRGCSVSTTTGGLFCVCGLQLVDFFVTSRLIERHGLAGMREPHVKHLKGRLWEMRMKGADGIARAIYVTASGQRVVGVHAFTKKTQKIPAQALETARLRAKEVW